jgi:hypothetical protein
MSWSTLRGHLLVLTATLAGIIGMGLTYDAATHGSMIELSQGVPLLMIGLWWTGRELGRSMLASKAKQKNSQREHDE